MNKKFEIDNILEEQLSSNKILFEVEGNSLIINKGHPFFKTFYEHTNILKNVNLYEDGEMEMVIESAGIIQSLFDILFMSFAKAESMFYNAEQFNGIKYSVWENLGNWIESLKRMNSNMEKNI